MKKIIKNFDQTQSGFKIVQEGNFIKSYNRIGKAFHFIDLNYLNEGILYHGWIGFSPAEELKEVLEGHFFEIFAKNNCQKMLIENTQMTGSFSAVNQWLADYFMPKIVRRGLKDCAVVLPKNIFAQLAVKDWDEKVGGFTTKNFDNANKALTWLKQH